MMNMMKGRRVYGFWLGLWTLGGGFGQGFGLCLNVSWL